MVAHKNFSSRFFLLISLSLSFVAIAFTDSESDLIGELVSLRSAAESGVIRLDEDGVSRFLTSVATPRPYSLIIFFDAVYLHSNKELRLQEFRREFRIVSASFIANNSNGSNGTKLFFCEIDSKDSESLFYRFAVQSLPHICLLDPWMENLQDKSGLMEDGDLSGMAETMAEFVERRTNLAVGRIHRPPLLSKTLISVIAALIVVSTPILIKKFLKGETLFNDSRFWLYGAVFVYFFSISGTMHNIIKEAPMYLRDHEDESKLVLFYEGSDFQLGAEGFIVGLLYTVVGLLLAFVTNVLVRVKDLNEQRLVMILALFTSLWAVRKVVYLDNWKTGYEIYPYWPSSWH